MSPGPVSWWKFRERAVVQWQVLEFVFVFVVTAIAAAIRRRGLLTPNRDLWVDESFSIWLARLPLSQMLFVVTHVDTHPPLFYVLLHFWDMGRSDPWWSRLLPVTLGTAAVPVAYLLGR